MLFLVTCASIAGCDDYDEIAAWGEHHRTFLTGYGEYFFGTPKEDWLRVVLNRIDPALFEACFRAWAMSLRSDAPDLIALDGKTVRRSGDEAAALRPVHLVSAWASTQRLVLAQEAVDTKDNECAAILAILDRLAIKGALVTIDAIATNPAIAAAITDKGGDYILALKRNQPTLHDEVATYFAEPATTGLRQASKGGRIETRTTTVSHDVGWMTAIVVIPASPLLDPGRGPTQVERRGKDHARHPLLHRLRPPHPRARRRGDPQPLGYREPALGARRHLQGRPVPPAPGPRRTEHGPCPPPRLHIVRAGKGRQSIKTARKTAG